jgi:hypothetical protein
MVRDPRYGTATNIWQIGLIMQVLMRKPPNRVPDWQNFTTYQSKATYRLATGGLTVGSILDEGQDGQEGARSLYSRELRSLIAECLLLAPPHRILPRELVERTAEGVSTWQMSLGTTLGPPFPQWQEPVVSAQWLEEQSDVDPLQAAFQALRLQVNQLRQQRAARPPVLPRPAQAGPAGPANAVAGRTLRVIVQTKPKYGGLIRGGHKIFAVENVSEDTTVVQVKDTLERQKCGIKATGMNIMCGRTLMANHQTLGEFPGLNTVRAMDA